VLNTSLVSIATDTLPLEGAWYEPAGRKARGAALLFHGNTMNFYSGAPRFLPPRLAELGLASLAFNRRGHDILAIRDSRAAEGAAFQTIAEAIADGRRPAEMAPDEQVAYDLSMEVLRNKRVSDETYKRAVAAFGEQGVIELLGVNGYSVLLATVMNGVRTAPPNPALEPLRRFPD